MSYTLEQIKSDLIHIDIKQFYMKHIVRTENWYFENILNISSENMVEAIDSFKIVVSEALGVSYNSIMMVGSGKTGYSLSPKKSFKKFTINTTDTDKSDIDIAVISLGLFNRFWKLFRDAYSVKNKYYYSYISRGIYRGYIDEKNLRSIDRCRLEWQDISNEATKQLMQKMYFKHEVNYRLYRSWEDFEEYNMSSIKELKRKVTRND